MAQTSTEWLINKLQLYYNGSMEFTYTEIIDLAKTFHSKEVKDSYNQGFRDASLITLHRTERIEDSQEAQNYYNETFKNEN